SCRSNWARRNWIDRRRRPCRRTEPSFVLGLRVAEKGSSRVLDPEMEWLCGVSVSSAAIACAGTAVLGVLGVASDRVFAAAGFGIARSATGLTVFRAHLGVLTLAAVHGSLAVFVVFAAAGHILIIFALAASHGGMVRSDGSLALVLLSLMRTAATGGFCSGFAGVLRGSGSLRCWSGLLGSKRQPGRKSKDQEYS